jgi:N-hydroxyarylamine O-acetyltransferase
MTNTVEHDINGGSDGCSSPTLSPLAKKYFSRLGLDPTCLDPTPTIAKLQAIQEAHLTIIPFENLSQHGCAYPAVLNVDAIAHKVLDAHRGGFCFELNGLLAHFLIELGYDVCRVSAYTYVEGVYRDVATHIILIVSCPDGNDIPSRWVVDVAFGEPPVLPLSHNDNMWDQLTPEGMRSKLIRVRAPNNDAPDDGNDNDEVHLLWFRPETQTWIPRLKWKHAQALLGSRGPPLESFGPGLSTDLDESSVFGQKLICCRVTRDTKRTLAGHRFKVTGPPRFGTSDLPVPPLWINRSSRTKQLAKSCIPNLVSHSNKVWGCASLDRLQPIRRYGLTCKASIVVELPICFTIELRCALYQSSRCQGCLKQQGHEGCNVLLELHPSPWLHCKLASFERPKPGTLASGPEKTPLLTRAQRSELSNRKRSAKIEPQSADQSSPASFRIISRQYPAIR